MKRALTILLALAAVACSKTNIEFNDMNSNEIAITPVSRNITKAAITDGVFRTDNHIALYAYYSPDVVAGEITDVDTYDEFTKTYFSNTEFYCIDATNKKWAGLTPYYWPTTGSMVFAGYSLDKPTGEPNTASVQNGTPTYELATDCLTITGYTQSTNTANTYNLLYFGRTDKSFDRNNLTVPILFKHALSWIEIQVKGGAGALVTGHEWNISKVEFKNIMTEGTFIYTGTETEEDKKAVWTDRTKKKSLVVFNEDTTLDPERNRQQLTSDFATIENVVAGTLVIPQSAKKLYVTVEYLSPAGDAITEIVTVDIPSTTTSWEAGKKYIYQLTFNPGEILIAPTVDFWPVPGTTATPAI